MPPDIVYRQIAETDAIAFHELRLRALKEHPDAFGQSYESQRDTPLDAVQERIRNTEQSQDDFILGLFLDEAPAGMVGFHRDDAEKMRHKGLIWGMYVASEAQGGGHGRELISRTIERIKTLEGLEQVRLAVTTGNDSAYRLYQSLGFQIYGTERRAMLVNGEYLDERLMVLFLNSKQGHSSSE